MVKSLIRFFKFKPDKVVTIVIARYSLNPKSYILSNVVVLEYLEASRYTRKRSNLC